MKPGDWITDTVIVNFKARCRQNGTVTFGYRYRDESGKQRMDSLGVFGEGRGRVTVEQARNQAKVRLGKVASGVSLVAERTASGETVDDALDNFIERYVRPNNRSAADIERIFRRHVRPRIGKKAMAEIARRDIITMLDNVDDTTGPVMADRVLAHVRKFFNWYAARDDKFLPPIVKGMARTKPKERARERFLEDEEIRDLWRALDSLEYPEARFPAFMRCLLLTAQRRSNVAKMHRKQIGGDMWAIAGADFKTKTSQVVPLSSSVQAIIAKHGSRSGYVFSQPGDDARPLSGFSKCLRRLNAKITEQRKADKRGPMPHWTLHDLRRTARSLMSRAGVSSDHAERVLGHAMQGVRSVYDRHSYWEEKRDAIDRLAHLVDQIVAGPDATVISFPGARAAGKANKSPAGVPRRSRAAGR
jgi:integrase